VAGGPGSGKSSCVAIPTLRHWPGSVFAVPEILKKRSADLNTPDSVKKVPKENDKVFGVNTFDSLKAIMIRGRKRQAFKLGNPRLKEIHFYTLRHWKATMLYHQTKDILFVKQFLGHKSIDNAELYI